MASLTYLSRSLALASPRQGCWKSKPDLSSTSKCDQNHVSDNYEFGHTLSSNGAQAFVQQVGLWGGFVEHQY